MLTVMVTSLLFPWTLFKNGDQGTNVESEVVPNT